MQWQQGEFTITTDPARFDVGVIHRFLHGSYWAKGIPLETVQRSIDHSIGFAILQGAQQVGFARVISDKATYAYLCDVFVIESARGQGLGKWLMQIIVAYHDLQGIRSFYLATGDAHGLYRQFGFEVNEQWEKIMKRSDFRGYGRNGE